ncbi:hypothetical protein [Roseomonas sp. GC11]|uniref:hypothetical protein n=1 Tax=Roseomonas sp. GC11 TaxID=2950546 RepID=UPI00272E6805|nr:hypothetical protein [Roseomonas sp. GC11]
MTKRLFLALSFSSLLVLALPEVARAERSPVPLRPSRDVAVVYRVQSGRQPPQTVPAAWLAAAQRVRLEPPGLPGWVLADLGAGQAQMVVDATRMVVPLPGKGPLPLSDELPPGTRMIRAGSDSVAGLRCEVWTVTQRQGEGSLCVTPDGLVLRASGRHPGGEGSLEALQVTYGPQDPARFQVPPGYQAVALPQGLPPGLIPGLGK